MIAKIKLFFTSIERPLALALAVVALLYLVGYGLLGFLLSPLDYNHLASYYELAWRFWWDSPGLPHYNPFFCGGRTLGADPQIPVFHPLTLLVPLLGPVWLLKGEMLAQLLFGTWALNRWLARWGCSASARAWGLFLFCAGGFTVARFLVGHVTLGFYALTPVYFWLAYEFEDASRRTQGWYLLGAIGLFAYCGLYKPNFFIYALPPLLFEACLRAYLSRSFRPICFFMIAAATSGALCAVTLLPSQNYFSLFPRSQDAGPKAVPLYSLFANLVLPLKAIPAALYGSAFMQRHEYSVFVGPVALWFAWKARTRLVPIRAQSLALFGFGIFSAWLGMGWSGNAPLTPFSWLYAAWPGFDSVRVPVRFWFGVYLTAIVFSAMGFTWPASAFKRALLVGLGILPVLIAAMINLSKPILNATQTQWFPARQYSKPIAQTHGSPDYPYDLTRQGLGIIECVENLDAGRSPLLRSGELLSTRSDRPLSLDARWLSWNHIRFSGHSGTAQRLAFNFNHHPQWTSTSPTATVVSSWGEPLTLSVPAGSFSGDLTFHQPRVAWGLGISLVTLAALIGFFSWQRNRSGQPRTIGLTGGIGSGKTEVGRLLAAKGWWVVDLDAEGRKLLSENALLRTQVEQALGTVDRSELRKAIFEDAAKRRTLEKLLHPALMAGFWERVKQARKSKVPVVVCEAALLIEAGYHTLFDDLWVVTAPLEIRRQRAKARDGISDAQFDAMVRAQTTEETRVRLADQVIGNSGSLTDLTHAISLIAV